MSARHGTLGVRCHREMRVQGFYHGWQAYSPLAALPRSQLANLLKEHCLVAGGDTNVSQWLKDESSDASLSSILKARSACLTQYSLC